MAPSSHTRGTGEARAGVRAHRRVGSAWPRGLCVLGAVAACHETTAATRDAAPFGDATDGRDATQVDDRTAQDAPLDQSTDLAAVDAGLLEDVVYAHGPVRVTRIFSTSGFSVAVAEDGALWGWGSNEEGTFVPIHRGTRFHDYRRHPQRIDGVSHVRQIQDSGGYGFCVLNGVAEDGRIYCWGYGALESYGEFGRDTIAQWSSPRAMGTISDGLSLGQAGLVTRPDHNFWFFAATDAGWHADTRFPGQAIQRVDPDVYWLTTGLIAPEGVPGFDHNLQHVEGIAEFVGAIDHVCMRLLNGHVLCWGMNDVAQGGAPARDSELCEFTDVISLTRVTQLCLPRPTEVSGIDDAVKISTGTSRTCVIRRGGSVWCWGRDYALDDGLGVIGDGVAPDELCVPAHRVFDERREFPEEAQPCRQHPTRVAGIDDAVDLSVGSDHSCVVRASGAVWCWGDNHRGQLGDGATGSHGVPVPVRW